MFPSLKNTDLHIAVFSFWCFCRGDLKCHSILSLINGIQDKPTSCPDIEADYKDWGCSLIVIVV